jgi:N-acetylmuramoyl-L-alanine amidase
MRFAKHPYRLLLVLSTVLIILSISILSITASVGAQDTRPSSYTVQPRDTLDTIGQELNVSVVALKQANNITTRTILQPGDVLTIPSDAPAYGLFPAIQTDTSAGQGGGSNVSGESYVMQYGDVLDVIAQQRDVSLVAILQANNVISARDLMPGTMIVIPDGAPPYGQFPATTTTTSAQADTSAGQGGGGGGDGYVVQPNDTLDHIAALHNVQTVCLAESNALANPRMIFPGQTIAIDTSCPAYDGYDVVPATAVSGDSG